MRAIGSHRGSGMQDAVFNRVLRIGVIGGWEMGEDLKAVREFHKQIYGRECSAHR